MKVILRADHKVLGKRGDIRGSRQVNHDRDYPGRSERRNERVTARPGEHAVRRAQRGPCLPGEQPGSDPRAAQQDGQHAGVSPVVDAGAGVPAGLDSVSAAGTTEICV